MTSAMKQFKARALAKPGIRKAYEELVGEFAFLDEVLRARSEAGLTQAELAKRIGTTQSAIARLESAESRHSPTIATLRKYADALGYSVQITLVKKPSSRSKKALTEPRSLRGSLRGVDTTIRRDRDRV